MDARFYTSQEIDIPRLATDLENVYRAKGYQTQQFSNPDQALVQLKKGGDFEAVLGMQAALSVTLQRVSGGVLAMIGQQRWMDKAAVGTIGAVGAMVIPVLLPLAITAGVGAVRQASLANEVLNIVDGLVRQQRPEVQIGPIPPSLLPQVQQQWGGPAMSAGPYGAVPTPPPGSPSYVPPYVPPTPAQAGPAAPVIRPSAGLRCPQCNTPYEPGDTFCSGCGRALKQLCPNCKTELKPNAAFCPKCGASTFQSQAPGARSVQPPVQPAPPPVPRKPPAAPAPAPSAKPPIQPYASQVPAQPPVIPKPTVTFIPGPGTQGGSTRAGASSSAEPTIADSPVPAGQTPGYQPQPTVPAVPAAPVSPPPPGPPQPIKARPASEPRPDPNAPWGRLIFSDGHEVVLTGERLVVGRYDHDLGGLKPDIDLGPMEHADTVSRVHALLEHIGSTFTLTDLNSTNATRVNGRRLEPDKATPLNDGDSLHFGKVNCTFHKL
ncbi:MAG: FHA domain-containing protein [Thermogemmatispora sp.]|uniref:FHA domain-containing protein n=1 Tax=Thermogemmatispora sp. TaxID=1968838 RepID=UPI00262868A8|nr:FHA domain-containing protein [Thermogemmatispora sp.]MBX5456195.1 FHA domain-containing protein [Thermogemmatispora sp.]